MKSFIAMILSFFSFIAIAEDWPELNSISYVTGRVATEKDIDDGIAVFVLKSEGIYVGKSLSIKIPQYALHKNEESGEITKVIIVQAESANDQDFIGALNFKTNRFMAGIANEYKLLGTVKPE